MQGRYLALLALCLTGCAATSQPALNSTPVDITQDQLSAYWIARQDGVTVSASRGGTGCFAVEIRYLIDSNGAVHEVEVLDAKPNNSLNRTAIDVQESFSYRPSESNSARTPVRVRRFITFDMSRSGDGGCDDFFERARAGEAP